MTAGSSTLSKRVVTRLARQSLRRWGVGIAVLALGVSGLFGGLEPVTRKAPAVAVGTAIDGGPGLITVTKVQLHQTLPPMVLQDKANHWLVVVAKVEITAEESWTALSGMIQLSGVDGLVDKRPTPMLVRDGARTGMLHPGMPEEVAFFWERKAGTPAPKEVTVQVNLRIHRKESFGGSMQWMPEEMPAGEVTLPLVDKRTATPASPSPSASPTPSAKSPAPKSPSATPRPS
ncbi:MAG TPA: hypothetical protein DGT23_16930 [Micromonosporaceae bacterium]|nr:hypothetical protein [Micromonosporaceae bacterium]